MRFPFSIRALLALSAAAALAACGGHSNVPPMASTAMNQSIMPESSALAFPDTTPPACTGQWTGAEKATLSTFFWVSGGSLCIPAFKGFGGSVKYPPVNSKVGVKVITSTTNLGGTLPKLGPAGTSPILYVQVNTSGPVTFGSTLSTGGGVTGAGIIAGHAYTAYGQASVFGFASPLTPCYTYAHPGTYGGVVSGFGSMLKGQSVPAAANAVLELYRGKSTTTKCG